MENNVTHGDPTRADFSALILSNVGGSGICVVFDVSNVALATVILENPAFTQVGPTLTLAGLPLEELSIDVTGTADHFEIQNGSSSKIFGGTCGLSAADMLLNTTSLVAGQSFTITSATYTASV